MQVFSAFQLEPRDCMFGLYGMDILENVQDVPSLLLEMQLIDLTLTFILNTSHPQDRVKVCGLVGIGMICSEA